MDFYSVLVGLRDRLALIEGINTCKIGLERGLSPDDYPIIRLVPTRFNRLTQSQSRMEMTVFFGVPVTESDQGLEPLYQDLIELEKTIKDEIKIGNDYMIKHIDTITDEDRLDHYKIFASRFEVVIN